MTLAITWFWIAIFGLVAMGTGKAALWFANVREQWGRLAAASFGACALVAAFACGFIAAAAK